MLEDTVWPTLLNKNIFVTLIIVNIVFRIIIVESVQMDTTFNCLQEDIVGKIIHPYPIVILLPYSLPPAKYVMTDL